MARQIFYHLTTAVQNAMLAPYLAQAPVQHEWCCLFAVLNTICQMHKLQACGIDYQWLQREAGENFKTNQQKIREITKDRRPVWKSAKEKQVGK